MYIRVMRMMIDGDDVIAILLAICHFYRQYHHHRPRPCDFNWEEKNKMRLDDSKSKSPDMSCSLFPEAQG